MGAAKTAIPAVATRGWSNNEAQTKNMFAAWHRNVFEPVSSFLCNSCMLMILSNSKTMNSHEYSQKQLSALQAFIFRMLHYQFLLILD